MRQTHRSAAGAALLSASLGALLAGCGSQAMLNTAKGERQTEQLVYQYTGQRVAATCPRHVPLRRGLVTQCMVRAGDGTTAKVRIVQTDSSGHVRISSQLMHTALVERRIGDDASRRLGFHVTISCPKLTEIAAGSLVTCHATDARGTIAPVYVRITDAKGSFDYRIPPK